MIPTAVFREVTEKDDSACVQILSNAAKKTAKYLGFSVTGTLGILVKAKRVGIIEAVRPLLSEMRSNGFYVSNAVERMVLEEARE